jgi:carboxyl-terminal processing protease
MRALQVIVFLFVPIALYGQKTSPQEEAKQLRKMLVDKHVRPLPVDDALCPRVWSNLMDEADPDRLFFLSSEVQELKQLSASIDDDLKGVSWKFLPVFTERYKTALKRATSLVVRSSATPVSLTRTEIMTVDSVWAGDESALNERWRLLMKSEILNDLARNVLPNAGNAVPVKEETSVREKVKLRMLRRISRISDHTEGFENHIKGIFFRSVANAFDPHSEYLSAEQMQSFVNGVSTDGYYFGFGIVENEHGHISVSHVVPGEPAWKSGKMEAGDVIERLRWEGKEWVDLSDIEQEEIDALMAESNHGTMEFSLRKVDGTRNEVKLKKEKRSNEQSLARGFLLKGKRTIGYINLPAFYTAFGSENGLRSANDVAKEIIKLKSDSLEGLILDLRYNGGGSLGEAVEMAGIFIDVGPVGIEHARGFEPTTLKDYHRGTVFDGPLVVLVNGMSASASEFLAAALQDHRRAVIVGTPTFGKAIAQEMFSLEPGKEEPNFDNVQNNKGWGYSTVTISRIYRINGRSIQKHGLVPDITIPDYFTAFDNREIHMPFAMSPDSVNKKTYYQPLPLLPVRELKAKSELRVAGDRRFSLVKEYASYIEQQENKVADTLDWRTALKETGYVQQMMSTLSPRNLPETKAFRVYLHEFGKVHQDENQVADIVNKYWIEHLSKDMTLEETYNIICDQIDHKNQH